MTLSERQRHQVLHEWNATHAEFPDACAHELFERQVERDPHAVAVVSPEGRLTYGELNARANQVAHDLRRRGVTPDVLVGVSFQRSLNMVVALLGVWKSGGAYLPIDPAYPAERLSFMIHDSQVRVLLTSEGCRHLFPSAADRTVCLDSGWPAISLENTEAPTATATPAHLAYVMYTSGSTGRPKGAMIVHSGLVNYLTWAIREYGIGPGDSVPVHSSVSFDLTVTSLYTPLLAGGCVELLPEDVAAESLLAALRAEANRGLVKITPAHLELLGQQLRPGEAAGMTRVFVIGGENLLAETLATWRSAAPTTRLINEYGPTETVVGCCTYEVRPGDPSNGPVPIGRPIANTQLYVLDATLEPVAPGVAGDLYIGGAGVARGYLNRPDLTDERFLPDPFSGRPGARLYRTGDLARYRDDGVLEFLGRADHQVKVRGYRIELGEIEAALAAHPGVQSCAVLAREETPGDRKLVAYVVARAAAQTSTDALRDFLRVRLPEYMVPGQMTLLDTFPLTPNGKVDREALPAAAAAQVAPTRRIVEPHGETERKLASIWAELLKVDAVGRDDDFFELGGHSLLAIKVTSRMREALGVDVGLRNLFASPTVAGLASTVELLLLAAGRPAVGTTARARDEFEL